MEGYSLGTRQLLYPKNGCVGYITPCSCRTRYAKTIGDESVPELLVI